jgi:predicted Zn-dependent protease
MEERCTPAMFGFAWQSPNVTVSYVPDGTRVQGSPSDLTSSLAADGLTPEQWQSEIQRAFQTWSAVTNLNFGFVADGGQSLATVGRLQGDTRFGDIRIASRPLDNQVLAITTPPGHLAETLSGDIILNSNFKFAINPDPTSGSYDLRTVMLQEIGHALGLDNSTQADSVMFTSYQGTRTSLSVADQAAVRGLYSGPRQRDDFEGSAGNATTATGSVFPKFDGTTTLLARGDITRSAEVDVFSFRTPKILKSPVTVRLTTSGISLLAARIELLNDSGAVLTATSNASAGRDLELSLPNWDTDTQYFIRVTAPTGSGYRTGTYDLRVIFDPLAADPAILSARKVQTDSSQNDTIATATTLNPLDNTTAQAEYRALGQIESNSDVDVYRVRAPKLPTGATTNLTIHVLAQRDGANTGFFAALAEVYDADGQRVAVEDLTYNGVRKSYQLRNVPGDATFFIAIKQNGFSDRTYELNALFTASPVRYIVNQNLTLRAQQDSITQTLNVNVAQVFTIGVESIAMGTGLPTSVFLDVLDANGKVVLLMIGLPGLNYGTSALLTPGTYTVRIRAPFGSSSTAALNMIVRMDALTDPIGLEDPSDPTTDLIANRMEEQTRDPFVLSGYDPLAYDWLM